MIQKKTNEGETSIEALQMQLQKSDERIKNLLAEIKDFREKFTSSNSCPELRRDWIPRDELKKYLQFGDTQMSAITKKYGLTYTEIGKRKLYSIPSLRKIFDSNKIN